MELTQQQIEGYNEILKDTKNRLAKVLGASVKLSVDVIDPKITPKAIQELICEEFEVTWQDIQSDCRKTEILVPRQVYCWLCRKYLHKYTFKAISQDINADHTTVISANRRVNDLLWCNDSKMTDAVAKAEQKLVTKL